ncbi:uncharacterized protein [Montipora foliosa]|uniref:uncharacterized protein n=1 Tax=Montipora foliosa TaxID=591990 RepID=UPI0035F13CF0
MQRLHVAGCESAVSSRICGSSGFHWFTMKPTLIVAVFAILIISTSAGPYRKAQKPDPSLDVEGPLSEIKNAEFRPHSPLFGKKEALLKEGLERRRRCISWNC